MSATRPRSAWRGLGLFWAAVVVLVACVAGTLQVLGPLPHPPPPPVAVHTPEPAPAPPAGITRPDPALLERVRTHPEFLLPRIADDGRAARTIYAAPVPPNPKSAKRVALLVAGFGQSDRDSRTAVASLPGPVSFAVSAYAAGTAGPLLEAARSAGHELLASVPMEPNGYPFNDAGIKSLMTGLSPADNRANLDWALGQTQGAVGATGASDGMRGEQFAGLTAAIDPIVDEVLRRGLLYIDPRPGVPTRPGAPVRSVDLVIDESQARAEIEARLANLERIAREKGSAIGLVGQLRPVTLDRLAAWTTDLASRGLVLVPVSSLVEMPK